MTAPSFGDSTQGPNIGWVDPVIACCPFCASAQQQVYEIDTEVWAVYCPRCKAVGPHAASSQAAIEHWGSRHAG